MKKITHRLATWGAVLALVLTSVSAPAAKASVLVDQAHRHKEIRARLEEAKGIAGLDNKQDYNKALQDLKDIYPSLMDYLNSYICEKNPERISRYAKGVKNAMANVQDEDRLYIKDWIKMTIRAQEDQIRKHYEKPSHIPNTWEECEENDRRYAQEIDLLYSKRKGLLENLRDYKFAPLFSYDCFDDFFKKFFWPDSLIPESPYQTMQSWHTSSNQPGETFLSIQGRPSFEKILQDRYKKSWMQDPKACFQKILEDRKSFPGLRLFEDGKEILTDNSRKPVTDIPKNKPSCTYSYFEQDQKDPQTYRKRVLTVIDEGQSGS